MATKTIFLIVATLLVIHYVRSASTGKPATPKSLENAKETATPGSQFQGIAVPVPGADLDQPTLNRHRRHKHKGHYVVHHHIHHGHYDHYGHHGHHGHGHYYHYG